MAKLSLSEAIRMGAMLKPQAIGGGSYFGSCALRAAAEAVGIKDIPPNVLDYYALKRQFPILRKSVIAPIGTVDAGDKEQLCTVIFVLNDIDKWTREQIAAWVEQFEEPSIPEVADEMAQSLEFAGALILADIK